MIITLCVPYGMFIAFNYKEFGLTEIHDDKLLSLMGSLGSVLNGTSRAVWGMLMDKLSFRMISLLVCSVLLASSILIRWAIYNDILYLLIVMSTYACYGGLFSIYPTQTIRILGNKLGSRLYFYTFTGFSLGNRCD